MKLAMIIRSVSTFFVLLIISLTPSFAQEIISDASVIKETPNKINGLAVTSSFDMPLADQAKRFGYSNKIGLRYFTKSAKNTMLHCNVQFVFGSQIREDSFLWNVKTPQGDFLTKSGDFQGIGLFQRGYMIGFGYGKILPLLKANANSGVLLNSQFGYMRYKINIFDRDNNFPQFSESLKKGYDRLTAGLFAEAFAGYTYFSKNKRVNAFAGFSFVYGATKGQRNFLYDVARSGLDSRSDASLGFKCGWIIPFYKKAVEEKYY